MQLPPRCQRVRPWGFKLPGCKGTNMAGRPGRTAWLDRRASSCLLSRSSGARASIHLPHGAAVWGLVCVRSAGPTRLGAHTRGVSPPFCPLGPGQRCPRAGSAHLLLHHSAGCQHAISLAFSWAELGTETRVGALKPTVKKRLQCPKRWFDQFKQNRRRKQPWDLPHCFPG